jgi:hypothetical protein
MLTALIVIERNRSVNGMAHRSEIVIQNAMPSSLLKAAVLQKIAIKDLLMNISVI